MSASCHIRQGALHIEQSIQINDSRISSYLKKEGFEVSLAANGRDAIEIFEKNAIDLVILDLMMPLMSGEEVCAHIRHQSNIPIIMLTAKVEEEDVIKGILGGADDYIRKPFSVRELVVRVHSILRRLSLELPMIDVYRYNDDDLVIDLKRFTLLKMNESVVLTPNEFKILKILIANTGIILTREQIIEKTFGIQFDVFDRTIDTHIKNIRQKIEDDPKKPVYIKTIYSMGYKFDPRP